MNGSSSELTSALPCVCCCEELSLSVPLECWFGLAAFLDKAKVCSPLFWPARICPNTPDLGGLGGLGRQHPALLMGELRCGVSTGGGVWAVKFCGQGATAAQVCGWGTAVVFLLWLGMLLQLHQEL